MFSLAVLPNRPAAGSNAAVSFSSSAALSVTFAVASTSTSTVKAVGRRETLGAAAAFAVLLAQQAAQAATTDFTLFEQDGVRIKVPKSWTSAEGSLPNNQVLFFADPSNANRSAALVKYRVQPDFTKMGSFGNPDGVGMGLTAQQKGARMLKTDARSKDGAYVIEYTVDNDPIKQRFLAVMALKDSNLYTLNVQCPEEGSSTDTELLRTIADSFEVL
eukprot:tig00021682_g23095.t1